MDLEKTLESMSSNAERYIYLCKLSDEVASAMSSLKSTLLDTKAPHPHLKYYKRATTTMVPGSPSWVQVEDAKARLKQVQENLKTERPEDWYKVETEVVSYRPEEPRKPKVKTGPVGVEPDLSSFFLG